MIYFVGAGPGDPELLTVKALKLLGLAETVVYAGSLVNPALLAFTRPGARLVDSSVLALEEIVEIMANAHRAGEMVVRLHSGDPSLFSAMGEQLEQLRERGIPFELVPGVSAWNAAAAALGREYTVPELTQTLIITRVTGRTKVPPQESLATLAQHRSSLCLFLSAGLAEEAARQLAEGYPPDTPVAIVQRASWPDQRVWEGTVANLGSLAREAGVQRQALILVGEFLRGQGRRSRLYAPGFTHGYRPAVKGRQTPKAGED